MSTTLSAERSTGRRRAAEGAVFSIIMGLSFSHFLNDMMQSLVPALYPMLKGSYGLSRERSAPRHPSPPRVDGPRLSRGTIGWALLILLLLIFSTSFYTTSLNTYYTF